MALVGMTGAEPSLVAWQIALDRAGTPYEVLGLEAHAARTRLTAALGHARFQAFIVAGASSICFSMP